MEIWKDIKGYEGLYQISNYGNVKSLSRIHYTRGRKRVKKVIDEAILPQYTDRYGYKFVKLNKKGVTKFFLKVHKLVATHFLEKKKNTHCIKHKDRDKTNNHIGNLEWVAHIYLEERTNSSEKISKEVIGINRETGDIITFKNESEAIESGYLNNHTNLRRFNKKYKGYKFYYLEDLYEDQISSK